MKCKCCTNSLSMVDIENEDRRGLAYLGSTYFVNIVVFSIEYRPTNNTMLRSKYSTTSIQKLSLASNKNVDIFICNILDIDFQGLNTTLLVLQYRQISVNLEFELCLFLFFQGLCTLVSAMEPGQEETKLRVPHLGQKPCRVATLRAKKFKSCISTSRVKPYLKYFL